MHSDSVVTTPDKGGLFTAGTLPLFKKAYLKKMLKSLVALCVLVVVASCAAIPYEGADSLLMEKMANLKSIKNATLTTSLLIQASSLLGNQSDLFDEYLASKKEQLNESMALQRVLEYEIAFLTLTQSVRTRQLAAEAASKITTITALVDNYYTMYQNGKVILSGASWNTPQKLAGVTVNPGDVLFMPVTMVHNMPVSSMWRCLSMERIKPLVLQIGDVRTEVKVHQVLPLFLHGFDGGYRS